MNPVLRVIPRIMVMTTCVAHADDVGLPPSADDVVRRLVEMDRARARLLRPYVSERRYIVENRRFSKRAEVAVREIFVPPDSKKLNIISETGSPLIRHRVIDKLIEAELDAVPAKIGTRPASHPKTTRSGSREKNWSMAAHVSFSM